MNSVSPGKRAEGGVADAAEAGAACGHWLNRDVAGMALTSFFSDACHEMVTVILPGFLQSIGAPAAALGWIEGSADASASFLKLGAGWISDRTGQRKGLAAFGYGVTSVALALLALAASWPLVLLGRTVAWLGRGLRSPLRKAMLAEAVDARWRGKAFGFHSAGDTLGAVVGPLAGVWLLSWLPAPNPSAPFRSVFLLSLIPGTAAVAVFVWMVRERAHPARRQLGFGQALRGLPRSYRRFLSGVGIFGLGDFSHTLLILAAIVLLRPGHGAVRAVQIAALLYVVHNLVYAAAAYPIGALADRGHKIGLLAAGYLVAAGMALGMAALLWRHSGSIGLLAGIFALAGIYVAAQDALEGVISADLVPAPSRATAYGVLGTVNGAGDFVSSALVGSLWAFSAAFAFLIAAGVMLLGTVVLLWRTRAPAWAEPAEGR